MNIVLWVFQILLALHTLIGAVWKVSNSEQSVPSLEAIPHGVWLALIVLELVCAACLILPAFKKSLGKLVPLAAIGIVVEMLFLSGVHLSSGNPDHGKMIYWLVTAAIFSFLAYGRTKIKPL
jgi:hypothetical protein